MDLDEILYYWKHCFINTLIQISSEATSSGDPGKVLNTFTSKQLEITEREEIYIEQNKEMLNICGSK